MFKPRTAIVDGHEQLVSRDQVIMIDETLAERNFWAIRGEVPSEYTAAAMFLHKRCLSGNKEPVKFWIASGGGVVETGLELYTMMRMSTIPIITIGVRVMSMASLLLAAGNQRYLFPHTRVMVHSLKGRVSGSLSELEARTEYAKSLQQTYIKNLIESGVHLSVGEIEQMIKGETYMTSEEAIEYGFADALVTQEVLYGKAN